ncbi:MAG TPA: hypothetical protein VGQ68_02500 [Gaiellaceae bacterium]|jgi:hypothetical protein|nr:hypothetical protein [Gaiellaceae bacterium]
MLSEEDFPEELEEKALVSDEVLLVPDVCDSSRRTTPEACGANAAAKTPKSKRASVAAAGRGRLPNMAHGSAG